jgi:UDP-GlcNAc:undecaprenyl-phosphate GlcNAc-1-phosphate transferase
MNYFFPFLGALVISIVLTGFMRELGLKHGIVSRPRARDIHKKAIPRIGGVAIASSFILVTIIVFSFVYPNLHFTGLKIFGIDRHLSGILLGGFLISATMLYDDIIGLKSYRKLAIQIIISLAVIASGIGIDHLANPFGNAFDLNSVYIPIFTYHGIVYHFSLWSDLLTLLWLVMMMNVINFVDGVDGLAGGLSTIATFVIFLLSITLAVNQPATAMVSIILCGSALGFLFWNFPPAKIFMGDSGSMFLGLMLGILPLLSGGKLATTFLVLGFPIVDGVFVALSRLFRGKNPITTPDKTHLHHRFLLAGFTPRQSVFSIYLIAVLFGWVALRSTTYDKMIASVVLVISLLVLILILNLIAKYRKNDRT